MAFFLNIPPSSVFGLKELKLFEILAVVETVDAFDAN